MIFLWAMGPQELFCTESYTHKAFIFTIGYWRTDFSSVWTYKPPPWQVRVCLRACHITELTLFGAHNSIRFWKHTVLPWGKGVKWPCGKMRDPTSTRIKPHQKVPAVICNKAEVLMELWFKGIDHPKMNILLFFCSFSCYSRPVCCYFSPQENTTNTYFSWYIQQHLTMKTERLFTAEPMGGA